MINKIQSNLYFSSPLPPGIIKNLIRQKDLRSLGKDRKI